MKRMSALLCFFLLPALSAFCEADGGSPSGEPEFVEGCSYDPNIPHPDDFLGWPLGSRAADCGETAAYFATLARLCDFAEWHVYGRTHEGRALAHLVVSTPENMARLEKIRQGLQRLGDPRTTDDREAEAIVSDAPAIAWIAGCLHGDELSGTDALIWLAYQLAAGRDEITRRILREVVVCIDPVQNPDGRERFIAQMRMFSGQQVCFDAQSAQHTGVWPWGRENHYFFDLNRDCFILSQPESKARMDTIRRWAPQLLVDIHEMEGWETYHFSPANEPVNPHVPSFHRKWARKTAADQAAAFDRHGWSYYTREWTDMWYPGYMDIAAYGGAVMVLYEQAGVNGSALRQIDGTVMTYRESVHHQITSALANLETLSKNRAEWLRDYYQAKKLCVRPAVSGETHAYVLQPSGNASREHALLERLSCLGVEVHRAEQGFCLRESRTRFGETLSEREFPAGTFVIPTAQPLKHLVNAILQFDLRMDGAFLRRERISLETKGESLLYDVSAWSMPLAYNLEFFEALSPVETAAKKAEAFELAQGACPKERAKYGFVLPEGDDSIMAAVAALLQKELKVRVADREFHSTGRTFHAGSFLLRNVENPVGTASILSEIARATGCSFYAADSALDLEGVDLGGNHFSLLLSPRIGVFFGKDIDTCSFGATWHLLDFVYRTRVSILDIDCLGDMDLRKYNVLVLPECTKIEDWSALRRWVENGGTLIALGAAVALLTEPEADMSSVRERSQVLGSLASFREEAEREDRARSADAVHAPWDYREGDPESASRDEEDTESLKQRDAWEKRFSPQGAFLLARPRPDHWLNRGVKGELPFMVWSSASYFAQSPVEIPVRFASEESLRVGGLLWPEARKRLARSACATREARGQGQIILFPFEPHARGYYPESTRLLWNAIFLGPGLGTQFSAPW